MMADKTTPGGFLYDPTNGGRMDEPTAVNNEARWREVSAQASSALTVLATKADVVALNTVRADALAAKTSATEARSVAATAQSTAGAAKSTADNADARVTALESAAGFGPSTPVDGQTASLILQEDTLTGTALRSGWVEKGAPTTRHYVYVSPSGSDLGDGRSAETAFQTFQRAFDFLASQGPILTGLWHVVAEAGVYPIPNGQQTLRVSSVNRVIVRGPEVNGGTPSAVIDGAGGPAYSHGLSASGLGTRVEFRDLKFVNFTAGTGDTTRCGVVGENESDVLWTNIHATDCSWAGVYAFNTVRTRVSGGLLERCRFGFNTNMTQATVANVTFRACTQAGVGWTRGSQGHVDYCTFEDNAIGLFISEHSRVDTVGNDFRRNNYGIRCITGGTFNEGGARNRMYVGTADANKQAAVSAAAFSGDGMQLESAVSAVRVAYDRAARAITGTVEPTLAGSLGTIQAGRMRGAGREATVKVHGIMTTASTGTEVHVVFGGAVLKLGVTAAASGQAFEVEATLLEVQGGYRAFGALRVGSALARIGQVGGGFVPDSDQPVSVLVKPGQATDSVTVYRSNLTMLT